MKSVPLVTLSVLAEAGYCPEIVLARICSQFFRLFCRCLSRKAVAGC